ncbi:Spo0B domain-containing protein [Paenibacillus silviterrae]|uniref:Spo0B domain-containing protein n=1 Tax=Paenibacillus silviterrae TaxID=3242194 RepID=UPI002543494D|nr:Spo0B domain-containing protein [Paenibacillus chinjuensis]
MTSKTNEATREDGLMEPSDTDLRMLRLFNHYRHDWMNDIQILFGYVKLKKYDKLTDLMEKIKEKVQQESYISKLGVPSLIMALLSFKCEVKELKLDVSMDHEFSIGDMAFARSVEGWILGLLAAFKVEASLLPDEEHELVLTFSLSDGLLQVKSEYRGGYREEQLETAKQELDREWLGPSGAQSVFENREGIAVWTAAWRTVTDT